MPAPTSSSRGAPARLARPGSGPTFRPNLQMLSELRLDLDPAWRPHSFYSVGMKAYGRAPTFLITTGNAGVRSIAAAPGRGPRCRRVVQLVLPETVSARCAFRSTTATRAPACPRRHQPHYRDRCLEDSYHRPLPDGVAAQGFSTGLAGGDRTALDPAESQPTATQQTPATESSGCQ
jgi:hypothetical protein